MKKVLIAVMAVLICSSAVAQGWPLGVRLMSYGKFQDAAFEHLRAIGVKHVFMNVPSESEVDAVMARLKEYGLDTPVLRGEADLSTDAFADELEPQLAVAEKMGARYMFLSAKRGESPKTDAYRRLKEAGAMAEEYGIILALETHPDLGTNGDVQLETMKAVGHPRVRVNFDTANITYYNDNTSAEEELAKSVKHVATVEFKDHSGLKETWDFPVAGRGMVDFRAIVDLLKLNNYHGPVTIEFEGTKGVELDREQTLKAIADSVAYVKTLAEFD